MKCTDRNVRHSRQNKKRRKQTNFYYERITQCSNCKANGNFNVFNFFIVVLYEKAAIPSKLKGFFNAYGLSWLLVNHTHTNKHN